MKKKKGGSKKLMKKIVNSNVNQSINWLIIIWPIVGGQCRLILLAAGINFGGPTK